MNNLGNWFTKEEIKHLLNPNRKSLKEEERFICDSLKSQYSKRALEWIDQEGNSFLIHNLTVDHLKNIIHLLFNKEKKTAIHLCWINILQQEKAKRGNNQ